VCFFLHHCELFLLRRRDLCAGVLFSTYTTLVGPGSKSRTRLQQIIDWCGGEQFDGCLVFDECHKAKNFVPGKEAQSTKVAAAVINLQQRLPRARVVYCSATGVSEIGNMAYVSSQPSPRHPCLKQCPSMSLLLLAGGVSCP
jgi:hypothetical protein